MAHPRGYCSHLSLFLSFTRVGGWGGVVLREGVEIRQAHPFYPQGSPVSSERPEYPQRGGEEGSWTLPVTWLAANVGWGGFQYH